MTSYSTMYQSTLYEEYAWSDAGQAAMSVADAETYLACEPLSNQCFLEDDQDKYQVPAQIFEFMYAGAHPGIDVEVGGSVHVEIDACLLELEEMTKQQPVMGSSQQLPCKKVRFSSGTKDVADEGSDDGTWTEASSDAGLHVCIMTTCRAIGNEFWWASDTQAGKLSDSEEQPLVPNNSVLIARRIMSQSLEPRSPEVDHTEVLINQPETRPISQEQLVAEVKGIYAGLVMVASKRIEVDHAQSSISETSRELNNEWWRHFASPHRTALQHHGFFQASSSAPSAPKRTRFSSGATDYIVEGSVDGVRIEASPDTGSDECIVSLHLASKLGKDPVPGTGKTITLANKKKVWSPGMVEVLWKFANDQTSHMLNCWILPDSSKEFVLGSRFLKMTGTLTKFFHRVKKVILPSRLRLRLMGEEKQRVLGMFNNRATTALADTGADLMLVSSDYVKRLGLVIKTGQKYRTEVELADGTRTWTSGTVRKAKWTIENRSVRCDFHVLEGLPADVILSKDYLFDLNVFSNHAESFFDIDSEEGISLLCGIRLVEQAALDLNELERDFPRTVTSTLPDAFNAQAVKRERRRRTLADKMIGGLPDTERSKATEVEEGKRRRWDTARLRHREPSNGQQPSLTSTAGQDGSSQSSWPASETVHRTQSGGQESFELMPI